MKQLLITILLLLGATCISAQTSAELSKKEQYKSEIRSTLQLDYSLPDYSTTRISSYLSTTRPGSQSASPKITRQEEMSMTCFL